MNKTVYDYDSEAFVVMCSAVSTVVNVSPCNALRLAGALRTLVAKENESPTL